MIPIGLPSIEWLLLVLTLLIVTSIWIVWTLFLGWKRLFRHQDRKSSARKRNVPKALAYLISTVVALFTIFKIFHIQLELSTYQRVSNAQYRPILELPQRLGGIDMPANTQLELEVPDQKASFRTAVFPSQIPVAGVQAMRVERYVSIQTDEQYRTTSFMPQTMRVTGLGTTLQQGWQCDATQPVVFDLQPNDTGIAFTSCILAEGNLIEGASVPPGSTVHSSTGNVYIDGFIDQDRWVISLENDTQIDIEGWALAEPVLRLDDQRKIYEIDRATLARDKNFKAVQHTAGASVRFNPRALRAHYPRAWAVQAPSAQAETGQQIVQDRSGNVLATLP